MGLVMRRTTSLCGKQWVHYSMNHFHPNRLLWMEPSLVWFWNAFLHRDLEEEVWMEIHPPKIWLSVKKMRCVVEEVFEWLVLYFQPLTIICGLFFSQQSVHAFKHSSLFSVLFCTCVVVFLFNMYSSPLIAL